MVLLPTKVFTTHLIRLTETRYFEFEGQISNSYQTAISLQIKIICRWASEGIKEILQVNEIYYFKKIILAKTSELQLIHKPYAS